MSFHLDSEQWMNAVRKTSSKIKDIFSDTLYYKRVSYTIAMDNPIKNSSNLSPRDRLIFNGNIYSSDNTTLIGQATYIYTVINVLSIGDENTPTITEGTVSRIIRIRNHPQGKNGNIYLYSWITYTTLFTNNTLISNTTIPSDDSVSSGNDFFRGIFGNCLNSNVNGISGVAMLQFAAEFETGRSR